MSARTCGAWRIVLFRQSARTFDRGAQRLHDGGVRAQCAVHGIFAGDNSELFLSFQCLGPEGIDARAAWEFDIDAKEKKKSIGAPKSLEAQRPLPRCRGVVN
jgi:hypothetical protein